MEKLKTRDSSLTRCTTVDTGFEGLAESQSTVPPPPFHAIARGSVQQKIAMFEHKKVESNWKNDDQYDLTPVEKSALAREPASSHVVDPFEFSGVEDDEGEERPLSPSSSFPRSGLCDSIDDEPYEDEYATESRQQRSTFISPRDIHPNMENNEDDIQRLRLLAGKLSADWGHADFLAPALSRRIRDFQFAQEKRRKKYGDERPWGILGVYDHLASIRIDVEWAEDAAQRRANGDSYHSWAEYDESKKGRNNRPYFTYVLLFLCTAVLIASIAINDWTIEPLDENPMVGPSAETLVLMGAKETILIVVEKQGWRLVTAALLHAGLVHYFINMLALWFVGAAIEMSHGWLAAMTIFTLSAVGGTVLSAIFLPDAISVGASGGIFGFIGACLADICMNWRLLFCDFVTENGKKHRHAIVVAFLLLDIALNTIIGLTPYVDNYNHLGGMVYGFLCGLSTIQRISADFFGMMEDGWKSQAKQLVVRFFGVIISLASIITTLVVLFKGDPTKTPCPGCTWLSCVPFPPWETHDQKWWYCDDCGRVTADVVAKPIFHLEIDCPSGATAFVDLDENSYDRGKVQHDLPQYCREYCPLFEAGGNFSAHQFF